jgi:hypothetical protein
MYLSKKDFEELPRLMFEGQQDELAAVNLLRSPVVVDGRQMSLAELIALAVEDEDAYKDKLKDAFEKLEEQTPGSSFIIYDEDGSQWGRIGTPSLYQRDYSVYIPSMKGTALLVKYLPPQPEK